MSARGLLFIGCLPAAVGLTLAPIARPQMISARVVVPLQLRNQAARAQGCRWSRAPTMQEAASANLGEEAEVESSTFMDGFQSFSNAFSNLFPLWTALVATLGLFTPAVFSGISTSYFTGLLGMLMLSMGITLTVDDFKRVLEKPGVVILGFFACYGLMPALALTLSRMIGLSPAITAGMVLVGSINGGQASNLCTYIAKGDVALSVLMTTVTTVGAIVMTPLLCKVLLGAIVPVDAVGVAYSTVQV